jgi:chromosomal replication initiation ATPase DnaA
MRRLDDVLRQAQAGGQLSLQLSQGDESFLPEEASVPEEVPEVVGPSEGVDTRFTFRDWHTAQFNEFAVGMSQRVVENARAYPLFLVYGPTGVGKSRLLNIIGTELTRRGRRVLLVTARAFLNECVSSIRRREGERFNRMIEFRERYRYAWDDLLVDGLEDLETTSARHPEMTQLELEMTIRALQSSGQHRVIFTSTKPAIGRSDAGPDFLSLPERLGGVLVGAMQVPLREPRTEELAEFARWFAVERHHVELPQAVAEFLAHNAHRNLRTTEGFGPK